MNEIATMQTIFSRFTPLTRLPALAAGLAAALLLLPAPPAQADDGHNHDAAPATASGPALPRFTAESDLFELVGVVDGRRLTVWLDHTADTRPVESAEVELDFGGTTLKLDRHAAGEYEAELPAAPAPGEIAITATVTAGDANDAEIDLLATTLDIHEDAHEEAASGGRSIPLPLIAAAALLLAVLAWFAGRASGKAAGKGGAA